MITVSQLTKFSIRMCVLILLTTGAICLAQERAPEGTYATTLEVNKALITAARRGDIPAIDTALAAGADINTSREFWRTTPLIEAISLGRSAAAMHLVTLGAAVSVRDINGDGVLSWLAKRTGHHVEFNYADSQQLAVLLQMLLSDNRVDVNDRNDRGESVLSAAVLNETLETQPLAIIYLLQAGADVNAKTNCGHLGDRVLVAAVNFLRTAVATQRAVGHIEHTNPNVAWESIKQLLVFGAEIPADLQDHPAILAQPAWLRNTPALIRQLTCGYHKQVVQAFHHPQLMGRFAEANLSEIDFDAHKFVVYPGEQILPGFDFVATGVTRQLNDDG
ncbi:MAG TPA: hypothetical protein VJJ83_01495, partial [Candidatus Babeliales bacterium]|nr:hypothetical protein [Candidatus Babeliales bacterium]